MAGGFTSTPTTQTFWTRSRRVCGRCGMRGVKRSTLWTVGKEKRECVRACVRALLSSLAIALIPDLLALPISPTPLSSQTPHIPSHSLVQVAATVVASSCQVLEQLKVEALTNTSSGQPFNSSQSVQHISRIMVGAGEE